MTKTELTDIARIIEERIALHGRLVGAALPMVTIAEMARIAEKCVKEANEITEVKKPDA